MEKLLFSLVLLLPSVLSQDRLICEGIPDFGYVASKQDCSLYYQCFGGISFRLQCPRGNYFSTERQTCVPYAESDCPLINPTTTPAATTTTSPNGLPTCRDVPEFGYIPSLQACDYYYQCIEGVQYLLKCPRGFYFSFAQQTCVNPIDSDCPLISTSPAPPTTTPPSGPPTCSDVPEFGYIPSLEACDYYYQCIEGVQYLLKCPRGFYFSFAQQTCVNPIDSDCPLISTSPAPPTTTPPSGPPTCSDVPDFGYIPSLEACDYYYQCIESVQYLLKCPRGFYFSFAQQTCVNPIDSDCPLISTSPAPPTTTPPSGPPTCSDVPEFGYIPSLEACDYYYQCIEGVQYLLKCPRGFYFIFTVQNCGNPSDSDCPLLNTTTALNILNKKS